MPNPFHKEEEPEPLIAEGVEGHFGCFEDGCGKVVGGAVYIDSKEKLYFTCPSGHKNEITIKL